VIKGQVIVDFLVEIPKGISLNVEDVLQRSTEESKEGTWSLHTDGSANRNGSGVGLILVSPEEVELTYALCMEFATTNNELEYKALIAGLRQTKELGAKKVQAHVDSLLIANQVNGKYDAMDTSMAKFLEKSKELTKEFISCDIVYAPRGENKKPMP